MDPLEQAPLVAYTLALTLTPGPSSLLIAASGARFGLVRCGPHLAGSLLGYELQLLAAVLGTGAALMRHPQLQMAMQVVCTAYLLWLSRRVLGARLGMGIGMTAGTAAAEPLSWRSAVALQLANPKSWMTAMASAGLFLPAAARLTDQCAFLFYAGGTGVTGLALWAVLGSALQRWLRQPANQAMLNRALSAALTVAALWGLWTALVA